MHEQREESGFDHQVVVVGAGPTGLMLAGELALAGVDVAVIERRGSQELEGLRAGGLHVRTLELLDQRGIAERFLARGQPFRAAPFAGGTLDTSDLPTRHNYFLALWQLHVERILADWVGELRVPVHRARALQGFTQDDVGVDVALSDGTRLRTEFLVGCDGGRSAVRKLAGIDFPGWDASTSYLIAELETSEVPAWGLRRSPHGMSAIGKLEDGERARAVLSERELRPDRPPSPDDVREALLGAYGTDFGLRHAHNVARFTDMARQAAHYRRGRVLLAGDAAHVHSPVGGQGLNIGMQDAVNLGWKLAQVVHGTSPESLLDSYHAERHPVGARLLRNTMALTALERGDARSGALREMMSELLQAHEARKQYLAMMSGLDVRYDVGAGHPLLGRRMPDLDLRTSEGATRVSALLHDGKPLWLSLGAPPARALAGWNGRVREVDARSDDAWELPVVGTVPAPGAVLLRPDGHVVWAKDREDASLVDALTTWFGPPTRA